MVTTKVGSAGGSKKKRPSRVALFSVKTNKKPVSKKIVDFQDSRAPRKKSKLLKSAVQKKSASLEKKLEKVSKLHERKSSQVKLASRKEILPQIRPRAALALLSPYRFPMPSQNVAVATARVGGLFFVITGAIFTLFFANNFFGVYAHQAQVISSQNTLESTATITPTPVLQNVAFEVNNPQDLRDSVQVKIKVKDAQKLTLTAHYKTQNREVTLGRPVKISSDTWEFYWDTTAFDDGEYKFKALINNGFETYERIDSSYVTVRNTSIEEAIITTTDNQSDENSTDTTLVESVTDEVLYNDVFLSVNKEQSSTEFRFEVEVQDASKVKLYSRTVGSTKSTLIGYAYKFDSTTWKYRWLVDKLTHGQYEVRAVGTIGTREYASDYALITVGGDDYIETEEITDEATLDYLLSPLTTISILKSSPLSNVVDVRIDVQGASAIDMYSLPQYALTDRYLGTARHVDRGTWIFSWDTRLVPNGEYQIVAEVKNEYGKYRTKSNFVKVFNQFATTPTENEQLKIEALSKVAQEIERTVITLNGSDAINSEMIDETKRIGAEVLTVVSDEEEFHKIISSYREDIDTHLQRLTAALRMNNLNDIEKAKNQLQALRKKIIESNLYDMDRQKLTERIDVYIASIIARVEGDVEKTNKLILERTGEKSMIDSDNDGISDYDEVNIYNTNPFSADTDNDGFTDGAEILSGFNPNDASSEALVVYESPKEGGIVREDILIVESVITATNNDSEEISKPAAIMSGKGLPNSFITLYVFSTPIVITVKTDTDGSWNYRFDKEIEDGEHQVYIGITDNAGKIIAKSNPFSFIKEAEAFTGVTSVAKSPSDFVTDSSQSLVSEYMIYLVLSISVVAIGLLLILLGLHLNAHPRKQRTVSNSAQASA